MSPKDFIEVQKTEVMAQRQRQAISQGAVVSEAEVKAEYIAQNTKVNLEFVRFPVSRYRDQVSMTGANLEAYADAHAEDLEKRYSDRKFLYSNVPEERKLSQIFVSVPEAKNGQDKNVQGEGEQGKSDGARADAEAARKGQTG